MLRTAPCFLALATLLAAAPAGADWTVVTQRLEGARTDAVLARTTSESGHTLEFYRDSAGAIRARFSLPPGLLALEQGQCPTLQVDRWAAVNRSANDTACLATTRWAEYTVGQIANGNVQSERLLQLMNGSQITFRYRLAGGDHRDAMFSLAGSKRALIGAIGADITFTAR